MDSNLVYLVQTDTTVGFSSSNDEKLTTLKQRKKSKKILQTVDSFKTLKEHTRIPKKFRKEIRKSKKTTFIYQNGKSFRVIDKKDDFYDFIKKFKILYSSSANLTNQTFDENFAYKACDTIIKDKKGFNETSASSIIKLNKKKKKKIR